MSQQQSQCIAVTAAVTALLATFIAVSTPLPTHVATDDPSVAGENPVLRFLRFETTTTDDYTDQSVIIELSNPTATPIYFYGYDADYPQQLIQRSAGNGWTYAGSHWCGSGMELHSLKSTSALQFPVSLTDDSDFREPFGISLLDHKQPFRVGICYGTTAELIETTVWSPSISLLSLSSAREQHNHSGLETRGAEF